MNHGRRSLLGAGLFAVLGPLPSPAAPAAPLKLALALGSGSQHGHALIGVLREFERNGLKPDLVVGTSVGAMVGALWASGMDSAAISRSADQLTMWRNVRFSWPERGLFSNRGLQETIRKLTGGRPIEAWPTRFAAVATDLATGERVVIDRGDAAVAVAASASMPVLCRPVAWGGRMLVDGALTEPVPSKAARDLGAHRVIAVDIAYRPSDAPVRSVPDSGFQAMHILVNALIAQQSRHADVNLHLSLHPLMEGKRDYRSALIEAGAQATRSAWSTIIAS